MRILMLVSGFPHSGKPFHGVFNLRAAQALSELVDVTVVFVRMWRPGRAHMECARVEGVDLRMIAVPQIPLGKKRSWQFDIDHVAYDRFARHLVGQIVAGSDLVHSVGAVPAGIMASRWCRRSSIHHVNELIGSDVNSSLPLARRCRTAAGWELGVHGFAANSAALERAFLDIHPRARNVRTIYRGVDLSRFTPHLTVGDTFERTGAVRFVYLGGFPGRKGGTRGANTKGGHTLLEAWITAEEELIAANASLRVAGPCSDASALKHVRRRLREPGRILMGGPVNPDEVPGLLQAADAVLLPSLQEGLPGVAMEASACGRALLASDVGGVPEVVINGETGLLLPPGNVEAWARALAVAARQPEGLAEMGRRGRSRMEARFDSRLGTYSAEMVDLYEVAMRERLG